MRVAILAHSAPRHDAVGNQVLEKVLFFQERGADVRVFLHTRAHLHTKLAPVASELACAVGAGPAWDYLKHCDLIVVEYSQHFPMLDLLPLLARQRPRIVFEYYGVTPPHFFHGALRQTLEESQRQRGLAWFADAVLTHSRFSTEELVEATSYPRRRITSFDLPIEDGFRTGEVRDFFARRLGIQDGKVLIFIGRMAGNKRPRLLVEALALLHDRLPRLHAVFIGSGADSYAGQVEECRRVARAAGIAQRAHFLGQVSVEELAGAYQSADLLVLPSLHEGFCLPVREAMACGLPVLTARTGALPETVGDAGLTFTPDCVEDLACKVERVLVENEMPHNKGRRVGLVCFRFGEDVIGGAERSLRTIGAALARAGYAVEVFTTCNRAEAAWRDELPAGSRHEEGFLVHRFPIDAHDRDAHLRTLERLRHEPATVELANEYLRHSIHSSALLYELMRRAPEFDAIIAAPYLFGLTHDVATRMPNKTLVLPCFHDEPLAALPAWPAAYGSAGGILFHAPEEQHLAQARLGVNHPNAEVIGACVRASPLPADAEGFQHPRPYLVYCGRYAVEKDLPRLLEYAERYQEDHPGQVDFVFMGRGDVRLPEASWAFDLGVVDERKKAAVLRGALALVQLSRNESLSLVALEAWREGTTVIVDRRCEVLRGQVERSGGGQVIEDYESFAAALNMLLQEPAAAIEMGNSGREYVERHYLDEASFVARLERCINHLRVPLAELMRAKGLARAERSGRGAWRAAFGAWVDRVLHSPKEEGQCCVKVLTDAVKLQVPASEASVFLPVVLHNQGTWPAADRGPGRTVIFAALGTGQVISRTELPGLLVPRAKAPAALTLALPRRFGRERVYLWAGPPDATEIPDDATELIVEASEREPGFSQEAPPASGTYLDMARRALAAALPLQKLPDDYVDVTEGWFRRLKRWLKQKLLGNFRRAYVDVLSRQQSQVNRELLIALTQMTQHCATLEHALRTLQSRITELEQTHAQSSQEKDQLIGRPSA